MANAQFYSYAPEDTLMVITWTGNGGGTHVIEGVADGTFFEITPEGAPITMSVGAYGSMARTILGRSNATITITLQDGSASNDILSALHKNDRTSRNLDWVFQVTLKSGERSFISAPFAYIEDYPTKSYSTEASTVTWTIVCNDLEQHIGGAGLVDSDTESTLADLGYTVDPYFVRS